MRAVGAGGAGRTLASQILVDQLTLSQPVGQIMPTPLLLVPQIFRPSYGPAETVERREEKEPWQITLIHL